MIKLVAFDLDGTIGDTIPLCIAAFKKALSPYTHGELTRDEIVQTFGLNEDGMIRQLVGDHWRSVIEDFYVTYKQMHSMCDRPFDGIRDLIDELKMIPVRVVLITGKGARSCAITLEQFEMQTCFERVETGSAERNIKADTLARLIDSYKLSPHEVLYIGDTVSDVMDCRKVGVRCLCAAWSVSDAQVRQLQELNGHDVFRSVEALRDFFKEYYLKVQD